MKTPPKNQKNETVHPLYKSYTLEPTASHTANRLRWKHADPPTKLSGLASPRHFAAAIDDSRALLTFNYGDFMDLHLLVLSARGAHHGVIVVRKDNDSARDMSPRGIVNAVRKLELADPAVENQYVILNYWR